MKAIYVDFSRGESLQRVEVGYERDPDIVALHLQEGEHAWQHDISLGVEAELRASATSWRWPIERPWLARIRASAAASLRCAAHHHSQRPRECTFWP